MRNGIKSIYDFVGRMRFEDRRNNAKINFQEPCFPKLSAPTRETPYWVLSWTDDIPTQEGHTVKRWGMLYYDNLYQIITFEDGTEWVVSAENRNEDMEKLMDYINNDYGTGSEMSRAARLLDDEMQYEI